MKNNNENLLQVVRNLYREVEPYLKRLAQLQDQTVQKNHPDLQQELAEIGNHLLPLRPFINDIGIPLEEFFSLLDGLFKEKCDDKECKNCSEE